MPGQATLSSGLFPRTATPPCDRPLALRPVPAARSAHSSLEWVLFLAHPRKTQPLYQIRRSPH